MADTGWKAVTTARSDSVSAPVGASAGWVASTSTLAACVSALGGGVAQMQFNGMNAGVRTFWLACHGPDMSAVPDSATVIGVEWRVRPKSTSDAIVRIDAVYQRKSVTDGANVGSNLASTPQNMPLSFGYLTFGSAASLGGTTWTPAEVKAAGFGVAISCVNIDGEFEAQPQIDLVESRVTFTEAVVTTAWKPARIGRWLSFLSSLRGRR